jgi:hypothetical protein
MAKASVKIVLEICGLYQKLSFDVFSNFSLVSDLTGQRSRSLIRSGN